MYEWLKCGFTATIMVFIALSSTSFLNCGVVNTLKYMPWGIAALIGIPASIVLTLVFIKAY